MNKKQARVKRGSRIRYHQRELATRPRLVVNRSSSNIYAQIITADGSHTLAYASTVEGDLKNNVKHGGNCDAARQVGRLIAERALSAGIKQVAFDRNGYKYHGRVKSLADSAREGGLDF